MGSNHRPMDADAYREEERGDSYEPPEDRLHQKVDVPVRNTELPEVPVSKSRPCPICEGKEHCLRIGADKVLCFEIDYRVAGWTYEGDLHRKQEVYGIHQRERDNPTPDVPIAYQPFPLEDLPEPIRSYAEAAARAIGVDVSYIALPLLAVMAAAIGNTWQLQLKRSWYEAAIMWFAIIGESGTAKSPAIDVAKRFPRRRQAESMKRYANEYAAFKEEHLRYERDLAVWKRGKDDGDPPEEPEEPVCERCLVDDTTIEAIAPILMSNWRGVGIVKDELAGWIGAFDRYASKSRGGGDAAKWIEMFSGRSITIDRKTGSPRTIYVPRAAVSVCGGIQPGILRRLIGDEYRDNGLLARLLLAHPPRRAKRWTEADVHEDLVANVQRVYNRLFEFAGSKDTDGEMVPTIATLTPPAKALFIAFVDQHAQEQMELVGDLAAAWSKLEGYAGRLALVHHLIRLAAGDDVVEGHVDDVSMAAGISLSRWFAEEAKRVYAMLDETEDDTDRRELVDLIRRRGGTITSRELQQSSRRYPKAEVAEAALEGMVKAGLGTWTPVETTARGGRPARKFRLA